MSYMSGMMMGVAFGQGLRRFFTGGAAPGRRGPGCTPEQAGTDCTPGQATPVFALARAIPGRRRYYARALMGNEALAEAVTKALSQLSFMDEVRVNTVSGSLLLIYHGDETAVDDLARRLAERVFAVPAAARPKAPADAPAGGLAAAGRSLCVTFRILSNWVKEATRDYLDLPTLLSIIFAVRGLRKILLTKQLPSGPQLLWWAYSLLRGWRVA